MSFTEPEMVPLYTEAELEEIRRRARPDDDDATRFVCVDMWGPEMQPKPHHPNPGALVERRPVGPNEFYADLVLEITKACRGHMLPEHFVFKLGGFEHGCLIGWYRVRDTRWMSLPMRWTSEKSHPRAKEGFKMWLTMLWAHYDQCRACREGTRRT